MRMARNRSEVFTVRVVIESDMSEEDHRRRVNWALENLGKANQYVGGIYSSVVVLNEAGDVVLTSSNGTLAVSSAEQQEIMNSLLEEEYE